MTRSTIANRSNKLFDKLLEIRSYEAAALSATTTEPSLFINLVDLLEFKLVLRGAAYSGYAAGTAEWAIVVEISANGTDWSTIATFTPPGTAFDREHGFTGMEMNQLRAGADRIRARATKTGSAGNLTYGCYLTPINA